MQEGTWGQELKELAGTIKGAAVHVWQQDIWPLLMALGFFCALALPMVIVMLVLWYIDSKGWRPAAGFYKIG